MNKASLMQNLISLCCMDISISGTATTNSRAFFPSNNSATCWRALGQCSMQIMMPIRRLALSSALQPQMINIYKVKSLIAKYCMLFIVNLKAIVNLKNDHNISFRPLRILSPDYLEKRPTF